VYIHQTRFFWSFTMNRTLFALGLATFSTLIMAASPILAAPSSAQPGTKAEMKKPDRMMGDRMAKLGTFVKGEHETTGTAKIVTKQGKSYLEFDQAFKTDQGPDLYVILYRQPQVPISGIAEKDYVSLGKLQKVTGTQRYAIPATLKLADFSSVAVWCRKFNATFGYAALK
jgi:Electron transfer DM13